MNRLAAIERPSFSGHESFPFRHGWLKKGLDAIAKNPDFFSREDALVELGVGKNMVYSIRNWLIVLGLAESDEPRSRTKSVSATKLGERLFGDRGWDPYLEDDGTLWLLHWQLANARERATTWWWVFHRRPTATFRREQIVNELAVVAAEKYWRASRSTIKRDVDCFILTYLPITRGRSTPEDAYAAPLTALGLIQPTLDRNEFILSYGWQPSLPDGIFAWGLARYMENSAADDTKSRTIPLSRVLLDDGSPGRVFRLSEEAMVDRLARVADLTGGCWDYDETAGLQQLVIREELTSTEILASYYRPDLHVVSSEGWETA